MLSNSASSFKGVFLIMGLYKLAMLAFVIGLIFFMAWAIKNLKKDKLLKLSIVLMVVGVLTCLLTMSFGGYHYKYSKGLKSGIMMKSDKWDAVKSKAKDATTATTPATTTTTTTTDTKAATTK